MRVADFPVFKAHPLLPNGHLQTVAAVYLPSRRLGYAATPHVVELPDGDRVVLHDDCPPGWRPGDRVALLMHGLSGCHASWYMQRVASKLVQRGIRTFRKDLRGCGAGIKLARLPYHSGRSDDAAACVEQIARICPGSATTVVGFSLSGNIVLKLLGERGESGCGGLDSAIAVCPPIELETCAENLSRLSNRIYDRHFVGSLVRAVDARMRHVPGLEDHRLPRRPRGLVDFDDLYTARVSGFGTAKNYYRVCSSAPLVSSIRIPTLVLAAADDPMIPAAIFQRSDWPDGVEVHMAAGGGHLGFIGRSKGDPDCRWMDWRIVEWIMARGGTTGGNDAKRPSFDAAPRDLASAGGR